MGVLPASFLARLTSLEPIHRARNHGTRSTIVWNSSQWRSPARASPTKDQIWFMYRLTKVHTWHSITRSLADFPLPVRSPNSRTAFISLVCPDCTTAGQPSCLPDIEGISLTLTFDQSHFDRRSLIVCKGRLGCYEILIKPCDTDGQVTYVMG